MGILDDIIRGPARERGNIPGRPEKMPTPPSPSKEVKKDTSIFGGRPGMEEQDLMYSLEDDRLFNATGGLTREQRIKIGEKLFKGYTKNSGLGKAESQLDLGQFGEYNKFSEEEKRQARQLIKGLKEFHKK